MANMDRAMTSNDADVALCVGLVLVPNSEMSETVFPLMRLPDEVRILINRKDPPRQQLKSYR